MLRLSGDARDKYLNNISSIIHQEGGDIWTSIADWTTEDDEEFLTIVTSILKTKTHVFRLIDKAFKNELIIYHNKLLAQTQREIGAERHGNETLSERSIRVQNEYSGYVIRYLAHTRKQEEDRMIQQAKNELYHSVEKEAFLKMKIDFPNRMNLRKRLRSGMLY